MLHWESPISPGSVLLWASYRLCPSRMADVRPGTTTVAYYEQVKIQVTWGPGKDSLADNQCPELLRKEGLNVDDQTERRSEVSLTVDLHWKELMKISIARDDVQLRRFQVGFIIFESSVFHLRPVPEPDAHNALNGAEQWLNDQGDREIYHSEGRTFRSGGVLIEIELRYDLRRLLHGYAQVLGLVRELNVRFGTKQFAGSWFDGALSFVDPTGAIVLAGSISLKLCESLWQEVANGILSISSTTQPSSVLANNSLSTSSTIPPLSVLRLRHTIPLDDAGTSESDIESRDISSKRVILCRLADVSVNANACLAF